MEGIPAGIEGSNNTAMRCGKVYEMRRMCCLTHSLWVLPIASCPSPIAYLLSLYIFYLFAKMQNYGAERRFRYT